MRLLGTAGQQGPHPLHYADGTIAAGGTAQSVMCASPSRSILILQNISSGPLFVEIGVARATAVLTGGVVTSVTINNPGFGFTIPPLVAFLGGGGPGGVNGVVGANLPGGETPKNPAEGVAVLSGGAVASINIMNGGANYQKPPYVLFQNDHRDPYGGAIASKTSGFVLPASSPPLMFLGVACPTDPVSIYGDTTGQGYLARWME